MPSKLCPDCLHLCTSHAECLRYQDFNIIVDNARAINKLKQQIKSSTPQYKGKNKQWFDQIPVCLSKQMSFEEYKNLPSYGYRFTTITFDPRKFSLEELTQPQKLVNYIANALTDLQPLMTKCYIIFETFKNGIVHAHINYTCPDVISQTTLQLRLKYYFSKDLRNRHAIHDRIFNDGGVEYMTKENTKLFKNIFTLI